MDSSLSNKDKSWKKITIMSEWRILIEVEQSLKQRQRWLDGGLTFTEQILLVRALLQHPPTLTAPANSFCPRTRRFARSFLPPEVKRVTNAAVAFIIKSCAPPWSRQTTAAPRSWRRNGRCRSKWTGELSCVLNSLLLSLGPGAVAHQTASLFSSGEEVQVCDELVTKSLCVQINSALCDSHAEITSCLWKKRDFSDTGCWLFTEFGNIWSWTSALWWRARIKSSISSPERPPSHIH